MSAPRLSCIFFMPSLLKFPTAIASELGISVKTAEALQETIKRKFDVTVSAGLS